MTKYRPYREFTAHGQNIATVKALYKAFRESTNNNDLIKPIVVFTAFSIEAYVNHLGAENIKIWNEVEKLSWKTKINILYKETENEPDWGKEPLQFASQVFSFRDKLAHGKSELVYGPVCETEKEANLKTRELDLFIPTWYRDINSDWVLKAENNFDGLITHLGKMFGRGKNDRTILAYTGIEEIPGEA